MVFVSFVRVGIVVDEILLSRMKINDSFKWFYGWRFFSDLVQFIDVVVVNNSQGVMICVILVYYYQKFDIYKMQVKVFCLMLYLFLECEV